jgi:hypothetical protein
VVETPDPLVASRAVLGPRSDLALHYVRVSLGGEHVTFQRLASDGTPLLGAGVSVHFAKPGPMTYAARQITQSVVDLPVLLQGKRLVDETGARASALGVAGGRVLAVSPAALPESVATARAGWRVVVAEPRHEWEIWVDGETGVPTVRRDLLVTATGSAQVYKPNPVTTSGDRSLRDDDDADSALLNGLRLPVTLLGLDDSGFLRGEWADVTSFPTRAEEASHVYNYTRNDDRFEEVNAYHHVDRMQRFLQSLGFTGARGVLNRPFGVVANGRDDDNSHYSPTVGQVVLGSGGVDDGEDGDVIVHEYGHALQFAITPTWTSVGEAGALGEGWGDLMAFLAPMEANAGLTRACLAPWDATSYSPTGCLRRVDGTKHYPEFLVGQVHEDGEIFSGAIFDLMAQAPFTASEMTRLLLEHQFLMSSNGTQPEAARALLTADEMINGGANLTAIRRVLTWHGLLSDAEATVTVGDRLTQVRHSLASGMLENFTDQTVSFTEEGAPAIVLHFSNLNLESDVSCRDRACDALYFYDGEGRLYGKVTGVEEDFYGPVVLGDTVVLRWVTDGDTESAGFTVDRIETYELGDGDPGGGGGCSCRVASGGGVGRSAIPVAFLFLVSLTLLRRRRAAR